MTPSAALEALHARIHRVEAERDRLDDQVLSPNARRAAETEVTQRIARLRDASLSANIVTNIDARLQRRDLETWIAALRKADSVLIQQEIAAVRVQRKAPPAEWIDEGGHSLSEDEAKELMVAGRRIHRRASNAFVEAERAVREVQYTRQVLREGPAHPDDKWFPAEAMKASGITALSGYAPHDVWSGRPPLAQAEAELAAERQQREEHWAKVLAVLAEVPEPAPAA